MQTLQVALQLVVVVQILLVGKLLVHIELTQLVLVLLVVHLLLAVDGVQVAQELVVVVQILLIGKVFVCVVLAQPVQILLVIQLLLSVHHPQVVGQLLVLAQIPLVGLVVQLRDFVAELGGVVVSRLGRRCGGVAGSLAPRGSRRLGQSIGGGPLPLPQVLLLVLSEHRVGVGAPGEVLPVEQLIQQLLLQLLIGICVSGGLLVPGEVRVLADLVQNGVLLLLVLIVVLRSLLVIGEVGVLVQLVQNVVDFILITSRKAVVAGLELGRRLVGNGPLGAGGGGVGLRLQTGRRNAVLRVGLSQTQLVRVKVLQGVGGLGLFQKVAIGVCHVLSLH